MSASIRLNRAFICFLAVVFLPLGAAFAKDQILVNGHIFTSNAQQPYAEAVSVRDGKIVAVGSRHDVAASVAGDAAVTDLGGKMLLPGLIDSHVHAVYGGIGLLSADAKNEIADIDALEKFVAEAKQSGRGMSGDVVVRHRSSLGHVVAERCLERAIQQRGVCHSTVFLRGMDGHTGWSNAALRKRAGLTKAFITKLPEEKRKYYGVEHGPHAERVWRR